VSQVYHFFVVYSMLQKILGGVH